MMRTHIAGSAAFSRLRHAVLAWALLLPACTAEVVLVPANQTSEGDSTPGDTTGHDTTIVQRADLTVTVPTDPADAAITSQLGWTGGVIVGATVSAPRGLESPVGTTDALGHVTFTQILPGLRQVSILRVLTDPERALLGPENADVSAFGGGGIVYVTAPATEVSFPARATRRGSLVISEDFPATWLGVQSYLFGTFLELYNNADTTIYLDGKLVGIGPFWQIDRPWLDSPCSLTQQWQTDPDGLWSAEIYRLPGSGRQYALAPGEAVVLATDAVDHSLVDPRWPDLAGARFEFLGPADVDNPAAANISTVRTEGDILGHGPRFAGGAIYYVADPVDVSTLPTVQPPSYETPLPRIPREKVLDVAVLMHTPAFYEKYGFLLCDVLINPVFDTGPAFLSEAGVFMSIERRRIGQVLLRSRSSVNDFQVTSQPSPGWVP